MLSSRVGGDPDGSTPLPTQPDAVPARIVAFLLALLLVGGAGWVTGRVVEPFLPTGPVPVLPVPSVLGGPGNAGHAGHEAGR